LAAGGGGRTVEAVSRRGKYIVTDVEGGWSWVSHLGMSGKLTFRERDASVEKHDHLVFTLDDGAELRYHDPRRFGLCVVLPSRELDAWPPFARLGPDPLERRFTGEITALRTALVDLEANFENPVAQGAQAYVTQMLIDHPDLNPRTLAADAIVAVGEFCQRLRNSSD